MADFEERYVLTCLSCDGVEVVRKFEADDLHQLIWHLLQFMNQVGYDYVDMLEVSSEDGGLWRAENL